MEWLKEHMRNHAGGESGTVRSIDQHVNFRQAQPKTAPRSARNERTSALDLVYQAADAIRDIEDRASTSEATAQALAKRAIEQLQMAERRIQAAEASRNAAESQLHEANIRLEQAEKVFERAEARIQALDAERAAAEQRAVAAEKRAADTEAELGRVEKAIRTRLLRTGGNAPGKAAAAA